jgi:hypothetical protein
LIYVKPFKLLPRNVRAKKKQGHAGLAFHNAMPLAKAAAGH